MIADDRLRRHRARLLTAAELLVGRNGQPDPEARARFLRLVREYGDLWRSAHWSSYCGLLAALEDDGDLIRAYADRLLDGEGSCR